MFRQLFKLILLESLMPDELLPHKKRKETRNKEKLDVENFQSLRHFYPRRAKMQPRQELSHTLRQ